MDSGLLPFFAPQGVVVVGASTSPEKLGYGVARNLVASKYAGSIHFVSQKRGHLFGRPIYANLAQVPDPVDLAVLAVPATAMPDTLRSCAERGIHAAIVISAGFREAGPEGAALEQECLSVARAHDLRLLGPNCIGTIDTHLPLDTTFLQPPMPTAGGIGFVSHSGAFCAAIVDWARREGFGFSQIVSLGNQADINETDVLPLVASNKDTRVVVLYMEGVSDGSRFVVAARDVTQRKPVIALKVGRFESGQKAAASHTGALAASDIAFDAAFAKAGIFRAELAEQMFDWARAFEACPLPSGPKVAVLTDAGGPGVIAADSLEINGLRLANLGRPTKDELASGLPTAASVANPVDMLASASPQDYAHCLRLLLDDADVDAALVILPPPPMYTALAVAEAIIPHIQASHKPVVMALMGSTNIADAAAAFDRAEIAAFPFPERAASALGILARRTDYLDRHRFDPMLEKRPFAIHEAVSSQIPVEDLVSSYGIPTSPLRLARSGDEAARTALVLGFPIVLKIASADILHKSDVNGVLLGLDNEDAVRSGYTQIMNSVRAALPDVRIEGVHLQRQVPDGQEVILGVVRDPAFGPMVMFGSGGVEAEGLKDVAFALAPLTSVEAENLILRTWAGRKLGGFRNIAPSDLAAVRDVLVRISWLAHDHPDIKEIEINPLRVFNQGAIAVDVRMKL